MNYCFSLFLDHLVKLGRVNDVNIFSFFKTGSDPDRYRFSFLNKPGGGNVKDQWPSQTPGSGRCSDLFLIHPGAFFFLRKNLSFSSLENKPYGVATVRRTSYFACSVNLKWSSFKSLKLFLLRRWSLLVAGSCDLQNTSSVTTVTGNPQEVN